MTLALFAVLGTAGSRSASYPLKPAEPFSRPGIRSSQTCPRAARGSTPAAAATGRSQSVSPICQHLFSSNDVLTKHSLPYSLNKTHESSCSYYGKVLKSSAICFLKKEIKKNNKLKTPHFRNATLDN